MNILIELWDDLPWYGRLAVGFAVLAVMLLSAVIMATA